MEQEYASVYISDVPYHADHIYDYYIPPQLSEAVSRGSLVRVPYGRGNRQHTAVVMNTSSETKTDKTKPITDVLGSEPLLDDEAISICMFLKEHTLCTFFEAVRAVIPSAGLCRINESWGICGEADNATLAKMSPKAVVLYTFVASKGKVSSSALRSEFGNETPSLTASLVRLGLIRRIGTVKGASAGKRMVTAALAVERETAQAIADDAPDALVKLRSEGQRAILKMLCKKGSATSEEISAALGKIGKVQLDSLEKKGLVTLTESVVWRSPYLSEEHRREEITLSDEQSAAYDTLSSLYSSGEPKAALLHGVTGSGKTSVIKKMIDKVISDGRGVIILVPEISLTPQTVDIFCGYYGDRVAVIHSGLSQGERYDSWRRIKGGMADIVIGTRSAVFAPLKNIGMIVIDEEQEHTYKSDTDPKYLAHDVARLRCRDHKALLLLSSATPSLTSYYKAVKGNYTLVTMKKRYGGAVLPDVVIDDMRAEAAAGYTSPIGPILADKLAEAVRGGNQAIIFLNRRGYNSTVSCRVCGEAIKCPNCSVSLTYHTDGPLGEANENESYIHHRGRRGSLTCHYCGYRAPVPEKCPSCGAEHFRFMGCGTQMAEEELKKQLPDLRVIRMDTDTTGTKNSYDELLGKFRRKEADVLLGTQMVAKGHDFPDVVTVGVMNADSSLYLDDYRAAERTFAMLTQVAGRGGRADKRAVAVVQTMNPASPVIAMAAAQDYESFYESEIALREALVFPPFCDFAVITVSGSDEAKLGQVTVRLSEYLKEALTGEFSDVQTVVYGPFEAPVYKVNGSCRMRIVIKCRLVKRTREMLKNILCRFGGKTGRNVHVSIDLNPASM